MAIRKTGFIKYASANIIEVIPEIRLSYRVTPDAVPPVVLEPDKFVYTRERAISAYERYGCNGNFDGWVEPELLTSYATFINVPRYVDHDNTDPDRAVGIVLDAVYHPLDTGPAGGWVETISAREKAKMAEVRLHHLHGHPTLLEAVLAGQVTDVSMGCFVTESVCTVCGNRAREADEYCDHVQYQKGARLKISSRSPLVAMGWRAGEEVVVGELNYGVTFFELSDITTQATLGGGGADPDAKVLERLAKRSQPSRWEKYLIANNPIALRQKAPGGEAVRDRQPTRSTGEVAMKKKTADGYLQQRLTEDDRITQEKSPADYDGPGATDKDKALHDQGKGKSDTVLPQHLIDKDRISQPDDAPDYALAKKNKGGAFLPTNSDPSNTVGGKPEQVKEEEDEQREQRFDTQVAPKLDPEKAEETEEDMQEEMEDEGQESALAAAMKAAVFATAKPNDERVAQLQDEFAEKWSRARALGLKAKKVKSQSWRTRLSHESHQLMAEARDIIRQVLAYGTEATGGGNPQPLVDAEGYDQGDPDKNLNDQSRDKSAPTLDQAMLPSDENVAQEENPDRPPSAKPAEAALERRAWQKLAGDGRADEAIDEIARRLAKEGPDAFSAIQQDVFDQFGVTPRANEAKQKRQAINSPEEESKETPAEEAAETPEQQAQERAQGVEMHARKKKRAGEEEVSDNAGEKETDISQGVGGDPDSEIATGTDDTLVSPATEETVGDGGELLSASRKALLQRVKRVAQSDAEDRLQEGTDLTKASPATQDVAETENAFQAKDLTERTQGTTSAPVAPVLSTLHAMATRAATLAKENDGLKRENLRLRESNERFALRTQEIAKAWKWEQCRKLAFQMMERGLFLEDKQTGKQRPTPIQEKLAHQQAKKMMQWNNDEIERQMELVAMMPRPESLIPQWKHEVRLPDPNAVKRAHMAPSRPAEDAEDLFVDDRERGW